MFVGVDIGGTFTDLVVSDNGKLQIHKLLSTPHNPAEAMLAGLHALKVAENARISHGSTVATNAVLERKGARTALITTKGFRDVLEIGRQNRSNLYALYPQISPPLIPRKWRYEAPERLDFAGQILTPLDMEALDKVLDVLVEEKIESVAVCFLYSFRNPVHENMVRQRILERGIFSEGQISLSCEVLPEFREYERTSTVALDAYVRPVMSRYLQTLEENLPAQSTLSVMKSDGGVVSAKSARQQAAQTVLSGPAAGVIGAFHLAKLADYDHIITFDMGGTSTDVALCPGMPSRRAETEIDGLPLRIRLLDIETVGAGGGSIARLDAGGALRVGPESAGASPGPIIYGHGGKAITVSDANAVLGRLDANHFLGGQMKLEISTAQAMIGTLAKQMKLSREAAALGILEIANVNIDRAIRRISIARGYDPRDFTLMAFGGAGPLHACEVAERLQIPRVLIPRYPGVLCALGLLVADVARDYSRAILQPASQETIFSIQDELRNLTAQAKQDLAEEGISEENMLFSGWLDMRYQGQSYELTLPFEGDVVENFHHTHAETYGHTMQERTVEIVNLRLHGVGTTEKPTFKSENLRESYGESAYIAQKNAYCRDGEQTLKLYDREKLLPGAMLNGPALIFQLDSTTFVPPNWNIRVDGYRNLILEYKP